MVIRSVSTYVISWFCGTFVVVDSTHIGIYLLFATQVPPAELEALLLTHPAVQDCAIIQVECDKSGELPRAYVVLKSQQDIPLSRIAEEHIYEWVKERVAPYKRLDGGIEFVASIPKSASGKILRRMLRDRHKETSSGSGVAL